MTRFRLKPALPALAAILCASGIAWAADTRTFFGNVQIPNTVIVDGSAGAPITTANPFPVQLQAGTGAAGTFSATAATSGGATPVKFNSAASTNSTSVKGSAGQIYALTIINTTATLYYLKLYDKASAPTCNSDTVLQVYPVPASTTGAGFVMPIPVGMAFTLGIGLCLTGALADNDNTNAATGVAINVVYK